MRFGFGSGSGRGRGRGHGRQFRMMESDANCVCPNCNTVAPHLRGIPCFQTHCPNCGAFMTRQFGAVTSTAQEDFRKPVINQSLCNGCQQCLATCPFGAIEIINDKAFIHQESCNNCRVCVPSCPVSAIQ